MMRRDFLAFSAGVAGLGFRFGLGAPHESSEPAPARQAVLVRSGFTRKSDGGDERAPSPSGMSTPRLSAPPTLKGLLQFSSCRQETMTPTGAPRFTCITNNINGSMS